jgi:hypothetical protein
MAGAGKPLPLLPSAAREVSVGWGTSDDPGRSGLYCGEWHQLVRDGHSFIPMHPLYLEDYFSLIYVRIIGVNCSTIELE